MNLKNYRTKILKPFIFNVNPNYVTLNSLLSGVASGVLFALDYLIIGVVLLVLSGFLDLLDGEIAKSTGRTTETGDVFDHVADRIVDMCIFGGIALSSYVNTKIGLITAIVVLMISYLGTQSQAVLGERLYKGTLGRFPRTASLTALAILGAFKPLILRYGIIFLLGFAILTVLERIWEINKKI